MKNMGGSGRDAYGSCFFIPLVPVFNLVVRRGNREFHVQIRHRVLPIPFLRLGSSSKKNSYESLHLSHLALKRTVARTTRKIRKVAIAQ